MNPRYVYLVRHAKAEAERGSGDAARALTSGGRDAFRALVASLRPRLHIDRIVTSPFVRARETAELLADATGAPVEEEEALGSGRLTGRQILDLAARRGAGVAWVGHNPEFAEAIALVAGYEEKLRPGSIAALRNAPKLSLEWLEAPAKD